MQSSTAQSVTPDNFWQQRKEFEKSTYKQAWRDLKWRCGLSLTSWIISRAILCGVAYPCSILGFLVVAQAWETSWVEALNAAFIGHTEPFTAESVDGLLRIWMMFFVLSFGVVIGFAPWKSPAARQVEREMDLWWRQHGDKMPEAQWKQ